MTTTLLIRNFARGTLCASVFTASVFAADQNQPPPPATASPTNGIAAQEFVSKAALLGQKDMFLAQMALTNAQSPQIQWFAQQLLKDHSAANQQLVQAVRTHNLQLPQTNAFALALKATDVQPVREPEARISTPATPLTGTNQIQVDPKEVQAAERLQSLSGQAFDQAFLQEMVKDHQQSVQLFQRAQNLPDEPIRKFAQQTLPKLQYHLQLAQRFASGGE